MAKKDNHSDLFRDASNRTNEIAYYKRVASECGISRLRETETLSRLIDQRRQAEVALQKVRDELERRVIDRTAALFMANASLKREIKKNERTTIELIESEKKYRTMFEDSPDAISLTQNARIVDVNPAWLQLHGYESREEVIGRDIIEVIHPDDRHLLQKRRKRWPKIENRGYPIRDIRKDGGIVEVEIFASRISLNGRDAILSTLHDLTERNKSEAEKRKLEERLRQSERMEAVGALASGVAHDLNNILSGLISYPELLLFDIPEESPIKAPLTTIKKSGEKAAAVVQDLLTLARRSVAPIQVVNFNAIIEEYLAAPEHERLIRHHGGVAVVRHLASDLDNIMGSPIHLFNTLMNLVTNAAEAISDAGTVTITTRNCPADDPAGIKRGLQPCDHVVVEVADTGYGIAQSDLNHIFEPFYTKKAMGRSGTGLGMAVVWGTVKDHLGQIEVESTVGKGTRFLLYFPASECQLEADDALRPVEIPMGRGESVLVIDDVVELRELAQSILSRLGYDVSVVSSGEEAVAHVRQHPVDLLLLDMAMDPGIDGHDTYRQILKIRPGQKAIITSGHSKSNRIHQTMVLGPCTFVRKPYTLANIAISARRLLDKAPENH
jgi:PAS domain S-box-containing protein